MAEDPKKLKIVELDAAQLPRSLDDLDAAAVNGNYAEVGRACRPDQGRHCHRKAPGARTPTLIAVRAADRDQAAGWPSWSRPTTRRMR
ncbi:MetQ/NlpA family ABC transporter substrate-binding protein [Bradyrhizobium betae]